MSVGIYIPLLYGCPILATCQHCTRPTCTVDCTMAGIEYGILVVKGSLIFCMGLSMFLGIQHLHVYFRWNTCMYILLYGWDKCQYPSSERVLQQQ